jgi:hypothetical protein
VDSNDLVTLAILQKCQDTMHDDNVDHVGNHVDDHDHDEHEHSEDDSHQ